MKGSVTNNIKARIFDNLVTVVSCFGRIMDLLYHLSFVSLGSPDWIRTSNLVLNRDLLYR